MPAIGQPTPRRDSEPKVRGTTRFAADTPMIGLLHARLVLAHEAHARILSIDTSPALELPGVVGVYTAADLPIKGSGKGRMYEPLAREEVVYAGQPVAMVVAESETIAEDGVELVIVDLDPLTPVLDLETACHPDSPLSRVIKAEDAEDSDIGDSHASVAAAGIGDEEDLSDNVLDTKRLQNGDVDQALAGAAVTVSGRFETPWMYQGYLETQTATAWLEPEGDLTISSSTQAPFRTRDAMAKLFGLSVGGVRVRVAPIGGGFGGKMLIPEPYAVAGALLTRRPVRLAMTRSEDLAASNPAGAEIMQLELGADAEGNFLGIKARILVDRGATDEFGIESIAALLSSGPYRWQAHQLTALGIGTNRMTFGAYRAPGAVAASFAVESLLDELAAKLGVDPLEMRLQNVAVEGDPNPAGSPFQVFGAKECLERVQAHELWAQRRSLPEDEGVGMAIGWWPGGYEPASAACRLDADGNLTVITGAADLSGIETTFAAIAADAFGIDLDKVRVSFADTSTAPYSGTSGGSKITYTIGRAVEKAALQAKERLLEIAADQLEIAVEDLEIVDHQVQPAGVPAKALPIEEIASKILAPGGGYPPIEGAGHVTLPQTPQSAAQISHVKVDRETGAVKLIRHVVAQDVGKALNPALVEGQMHGGATQGLGWALLEQISHDEHGQLTTGTFVDYAMPTAGSVPMIETEIVEVPTPEGPYGAKGVGEAPIVAAAGAVANAIANATGARMHQLPMTPERVWRQLSADATNATNGLERTAEGSPTTG